MSGINPYSGAQPQYQGNPQTQATTQAGYTGVPQQGVAYRADGYKASSYSTGYAQGVGTTAPAMGVGGLANGVGSMANSIGGIFGTVINLITNILNTIVNLVMKAVDGILGLFGVGKKDKVAEAGGVNPSVPLSGNQGQGISTPAGTAVPPPPPGTDVNQAYSIVDADLKTVADPNQGVQIVNIHAQKARDYRDKSEQFAKEAEKESREALYSAEQLKSNPTDQKLLGQLQSHKSKAMDLLKASQEYTKAVYDECLYAQAANDVLNAKFQGAMAGKGNSMVTDSWKNWIGGTTEKSFIFFSKDIKSAPEVFMTSMNSVNANLGRATQILTSMSPAAAAR